MILWVFTENKVEKRGGYVVFMEKGAVYYKNRGGILRLG